MFSFLELTDGTVSTACELTDLVRYALVSYGPGVAAQRDSLLGGAGVYDDTIDTITFHAIGSTAAEAYANAAAVNRLLDQARQWWHGEHVNPVTIRASVQDSTVGPLSAIVIGRSPGGPPPLALQVAFDEHYGNYISENLTIQFIRGDTWFGATQSATSNSAAMPSVLTATFAVAQSIQTPSVLTLSGPLRRSVLALQLGYLIVAPQNRIEIVEGESTTNTGSATATVTADATNHASAGNVMRLSNAPATGQLTGTFSANFAANAYQVACFAVLRVNASPNVPALPITAFMQLKRGSFFVNGPSVDVNYAYFGAGWIPQPVFLGVIDSRLPFETFLFSIAWSDAANTIDVDYLVFVALNDAPDARVVATVINPNTYTSFSGSLSTSPISVTYDPQALALPAATVTGTSATDGKTEPWSVVGDPFLVSKEANMTGMWLATMGTNWRPWDSTAAAAISFTLAWSRKVPYLVPQ